MIALLRCSFRVTGWEEAIEEVVRTHFWNRTENRADTELSVFAAPRADTVRVVTEFAASYDLNVRPKTLVFDVSEITAAPVKETDGDTRFAYTRKCHREIHFPSEADLVEFVQALLRERESRQITVTKGELKQYIADRNAAGDPEWLAEPVAYWKP